MPPNPSTTPLLINGEIIQVEINQFDTLPTSFYCPDCNRCHFVNDISFAADNNGRAWGSAWLDHGYINTETNDEESSYENMTYSCDHCENDITEELHSCERWNNLIQQQMDITARANNYESVSQFRDQLKNELEHVSFILDKLRGASLNVPERIEVFNVDHDRNFIRVRISDPTGVAETYIVNPRIIEEAKRIMHDEFNSRKFKFNYDDPVYQKVNKLYLGLVAQISILPGQTTPPSDSLWTGERCIEMYNNVMEGNIPEIVVVQPPPTEPVEPRERDPLSSPIREFSHHRRWRENSFDNICECKHCKYLFEADNNLDILVCPKCSKEAN